MDIPNKWWVVEFKVENKSWGRIIERPPKFYSHPSIVLESPQSADEDASLLEQLPHLVVKVSKDFQRMLSLGHADEQDMIRIIGKCKTKHEAHGALHLIATLMITGVIEKNMTLVNRVKHITKLAEEPRKTERGVKRKRCDFCHDK
jgi:hypothetical protein